ncbi:MAG: B12-binding domain-containing radical SAM protein [Deltaproteobacteria bacterium]|nr:B12-binding domain-containing radical SAM protein [Deltaproteobacteria bacterium]MBM4322859.1 B12-binding domain-containing radical SAM protein [Deltaproteobacteria bacterium]
MNILLIQPPRKQFLGGGIDYWEPLSLETAVSELPDHHNIVLFCPGILPNIPIEDLLSKSQFDIAAITGFGGDEAQIYEICRKIRKNSPETNIVVGGWWATIYPHAFFNPMIDFIVYGEGELTFRDLVQYLEKNKSLSEIDSVKGLYYQADNGFFHFTGKRPSPDLATLNPPRRDLFEPFRIKITAAIREKNPNFRSFYLIQTTRGCNHRCDFCSVWSLFEGKVRRKTRDQLERELNFIPNDAFIDFADDNFLMSGDWVRDIAGLLKGKNFCGNLACFARVDDIARNPKLIEALAEVGLKSVFVGFETFEDGDQVFSKNIPFNQHQEVVNILHQNGVMVIGSFIVDPGWDKEDFKRFANYLLTTKIDEISLQVLIPLPGTRLYEKTKRTIVGTRNAELGHIQSILPTRLDPKEFVKKVHVLLELCAGIEMNKKVFMGSEDSLKTLGERCLKSLE